jgi:hypothetical protein
VPVVPLLGISSCIYLMISLPRITWLRFGVWLAVGLLIYAWYGLSHSRLLDRETSRWPLRAILSGTSAIVLGFVSLAANHHYRGGAADRYARSMLRLTDAGFKLGVILGVLLVITGIIIALREPARRAKPPSGG